jgi:hypothetical protein
MSHFTVLVIGDNPEEQLQPFHEYECTGIKDQYVKFVPCEETSEQLSKEFKEKQEEYNYADFSDFMKDSYGYEQDEEGNWGRETNPNAKWDWFQLGGRWTGFFKLKAHVKFEYSNVKVGDPGLMTDHPKQGYADQTPKKYIDFESMREEAKRKASEEYKKIENFFGGEIPKIEIPWKEISDEKGKYKDLSWDKRRDLYHAQPALRKLKNLREEYRQRPATKESEKERSLFGLFDLSKFQITHDEYVNNAGAGALSTFAVIKDGKWYEKGEMGWWACVSNEKKENDWIKEFHELIDTLSEDTLLSVYDCHI